MIQDPWRRAWPAWIQTRTVIARMAPVIAASARPRDRGEDRAGVVVVLQELAELDHADDGEDQRQPEVGTHRAVLATAVDQEGEDGEADQQIHGSGGVHGLNASPVAPGRPVLIIQARR